MPESLLTAFLNALISGGPLAVVLAMAVLYLARRDAARDERERQDRRDTTQAINNSTSAMREMSGALDELRRVVERRKR